MAECVQMIIVSACLIIVFLWFHFRNRNAIITNWPVLGMVPSLYRNLPRIHDFLADLMIQSGGTFEFVGPWFLNKDSVHTCDPRNIYYVQTQNLGNFCKGPLFKDVFDAWGDGIFNADKDLWKMQRRTIQLSLRKENVFRFLRNGVKVKVADGMIPRLNLASEENEEIDLQALFQQFTFDTVCLMVLGVDPGSISGKSGASKYQKAFDEMEEAVMSRLASPTPVWKLKRWLHIGTEKQYAEGVKIMDSFLYECVSLQTEQLKRARAIGEEPNLTILTSFLDQQDESVIDRNGDVKVSSKLLRDVALNLLFAGRDTISDTLTWFFFLVATHPLVETKILREIEENSDTCTDLVEKDSGVFPEDKLGGLVYMHAALSETLRLYPPVSCNMKHTIVPDRLPSGHEVRSKTRIVLPLYAMGRMESVWGTDCREFKPERWISEQGHLIQVPSYKFPAFSSGPRICVGKDLSFLQMKMVAASLMSNFHIRAIEGHPVVPSPSISLHAKHGLKVRVRRRNTSR